MNTFGRNLRLTTFGESHGKAMGGILDGMPGGIKIDMDIILRETARRRPGQSHLVTARNEKDIPELLSGLTDDMVTLGTPIGFIVRNTDQRSGDYGEMAELYRPNHADFTYDMRYGLHEPRGGGRASARETLNWVIGGAIARQLPCMKNISVKANVASIGGIKGTREELEKVVESAMKRGDSVGGVVECVIEGVPAGIGNPVFGKLHARLAQAMMSINAAKGFEYGDGFSAASAYGTEQADIFTSDAGHIHTLTNHSGGIQGGISNGMPITFKVAFKPTPTLLCDIETVDKEGHTRILRGKGRHDPCVALRAVPVVEAMTVLVLADEMLERNIK
ncbi:MAG: chorismate synthase [Muribaculaceae bacterium]|nr:chorismate synthase [Muribaculaceae bacterium]MDE6631462.1 chorismate synthase [Muribaculaceae bacterium]